MYNDFKKILNYLKTNKYREAFILLNSIKLNSDSNFDINIPSYFRVGQLERNNKKGFPFHLYFIDVYDDRDMMHFYRTLGKLYTNPDVEIEDIPEKDIKKYFVPQFIQMLEKYLDDYNIMNEAVSKYSKGDDRAFKNADVAVEVMNKTRENMNNHQNSDLIEFVDVELLDKIKEFDRRVQRVKTDEDIDELKNKIISNGITEPVMIDICPFDGTLKLGEGNHRLMIAKELGLPKVPAIAIRSMNSIHNYKMKVDPEGITPREDGIFGKYYYQPMKPSYLGEPFGPNYNGEIKKESNNYILFRGGKNMRLSEIIMNNLKESNNVNYDDIMEILLKNLSETGKDYMNGSIGESSVRKNSEGKYYLELIDMTNNSCINDITYKIYFDKNDLEDTSKWQIEKYRGNKYCGLSLNKSGLSLEEFDKNISSLYNRRQNKRR